MQKLASEWGQPDETCFRVNVVWAESANFKADYSHFRITELWVWGELESFLLKKRNLPGIVFLSQLPHLWNLILSRDLFCTRGGAVQWGTKAEGRGGLLLRQAGCWDGCSLILTFSITAYIGRFRCHYDQHAFFFFLKRRRRRKKTLQSGELHKNLNICWISHWEPA